MAHPVIHFEIISKEPEKLSEFYRNAFDWNIQAFAGAAAETQGETMSYFLVRPDGNDDPEHGINGGIGAAPDGYDGHVTVYVRVTGVPATLEKIQKLGGTVMMPPREVPGMVIALFKDPQGNTIGLVDPQM